VKLAQILGNIIKKAKGGSEVYYNGTKDTSIKKAYINDKWIYYKSFPKYKSSGDIVSYRNKIYAWGFYDESLTNKYSKWYSFDGNNWTQIGNIPYYSNDSSGAPRGVVYHDKIHILGGTSGSDARKHYAWNGSSWSSQSTLPYYVFDTDVSAIVYKDKIHLLGGHNTEDEKKHYAWDGSSWSSQSTLPFEMKAGAVAVYNNKLHIMDGTKHYAWDGSSWSSQSTLPVDTDRAVAIAYNGEIHLFGGYNGDSIKKHYTWDGNSWREKNFKDLSSAADVGLFIHEGNLYFGKYSSIYVYKGYLDKIEK
jgi:N-acetylneuraminic acid mutarotase